MALDLDKPIIWTKDGNRNVDELNYGVSWEISEQAVICIETYQDKVTGEIVRESRHGFLKKATESGVEQALLG